MASSRWRYVIGAILLLLALITAYPFWYVIVSSFSDPVSGDKAWIVPVDWFAMNYKVVFLTKGIMRSYLNTILRVAIGVPIYLLLTGMTAFAFSRKELRGRRWIIWFYLVPLYFDGGFIPFYVWMRQIGMYNTFLMYILPAAYGMWAMIVMKTAFKEIPESLLESAFMDGAGYFRTFVSIIIPLSLPMLATMGLFCAVTYWNDWTVGTFYMQDQDKWTLQTFLQLAVLKGRAQSAVGFSTGGSAGAYNIMDWNMSPQEYEKLLKLNSKSMEMAYIVISTAPILLIYPWIQRYFIKGVLIGSVKE